VSAICNENIHSLPRPGARAPGALGAGARGPRSLGSTTVGEAVCSRTVSPRVSRERCVLALFRLESLASARADEGLSGAAGADSPRPPAPPSVAARSHGGSHFSDRSHFFALPSSDIADMAKSPVMRDCPAPWPSARCCWRCDPGRDTGSHLGLRAMQCSLSRLQEGERG